MSRLQADLTLVLVTWFAALGWLVSLLALAELPPLIYASLRFGLAGMVLLCFCAPRLLRQPWTIWRSALINGAVFSVSMSLWIVGLQHTAHISEAAFIVSLAVVLTPILGRLFFNEVLTASILIALPIAVFGLGMLSLQQGFQLERGQGLLLLSALGFALHTQLTARGARKVPPLLLATVQLLIAGLWSACGAITLESWPSQVSLPTWSYVLVAALIATSIRFYLHTQALKHTTASHAGMVLVLEPLWTAVLGVALLAESMSSNQWIGAGLIITAVMIKQIASLRETSPTL